MLVACGESTSEQGQGPGGSVLVSGWTVCSHCRGPVYYRWHWPSSSWLPTKRCLQAQVNEFSRGKGNCALKLMLLLHEYFMREMLYETLRDSLCAMSVMLVCIYRCSYHFWCVVGWV